MSMPYTVGQSPGRRRPPKILLALGWEAILLVLAVVTTGLVAAQGPGLNVMGNPGTFYRTATLGLLAVGFALSLRTATPNLAVAAVAGTAGIVFATLIDGGLPAIVAGLLAVLASLVFGLILGVIVGLTSAPSWAVTIGGFALLQAVGAVIQEVPGTIVVPGLSSPSLGMAITWLLVFVIISIGGGVIWQIPAVRALLGVNRSPVDPVRFHGKRLAGALAGLGGSSLLAGLSGVVLVSYLGASSPTLDNDRLALAIGAALLGGVSVFGARGGIAGTVLAVWLLSAAQLGLDLEGAPRWVGQGLLAGLAVVVGVLVSRVLEAIAGPDGPPAAGPVAPVGAPLPVQPQPVSPGGTALP
jgi:ribose transport system permease protein